MDSPLPHPDPQDLPREPSCDAGPYCSSLPSPVCRLPRGPKAVPRPTSSPTRARCSATGRPTAIRRRAGSCCTSRASPTSAAYQHGRLLAPEIAAYVRCFAAMQSPKAPADGWKHTRHPRQRPVPAPLRRGIPRRDEGHRRRRQRRRGALRRPAHRPRRHRRPQLPGRRSRRSTPPSRPRRPAWKASASRDASRSRSPLPQADALQRLRRHRPGHRRRQDRLRPHHHVRPLPVELLQRLARRQAGQGPSRPDAELPRRHPERHGLLPERRRPAHARDDHRPDPLRHHAAWPLASRIRQAHAVRRHASTRRWRSSRKRTTACTPTNGCSADIKTNEIAMFELGTHKSKLWRSSKNEWFGGTEGFYWGCNNTKDLDVRLETIASVDGRPANVVFQPVRPRHDLAASCTTSTRARSTPTSASWRSRRRRSPPITRVDAKFTTTDMAKRAEDAGRCSARRWAGPGSRPSTSGSASPRSSRW